MERARRILLTTVQRYAAVPSLMLERYVKRAGERTAPRPLQAVKGVVGQVDVDLQQHLHQRLPIIAFHVPIDEEREAAQLMRLRDEHVSFRESQLQVSLLKT